MGLNIITEFTTIFNQTNKLSILCAATLLVAIHFVAKSVPHFGVLLLVKYIGLTIKYIGNHKYNNIQYFIRILFGKMLLVITLVNIVPIVILILAIIVVIVVVVVVCRKLLITKW